jgi:hypothetical protein
VGEVCHLKISLQRRRRNLHFFREILIGIYLIWECRSRQAALDGCHGPPHSAAWELLLANWDAEVLLLFSMGRRNLAREEEGEHIPFYDRRAPRFAHSICFISFSNSSLPPPLKLKFTYWRINLPVLSISITRLIHSYSFSDGDFVEDFWKWNDLSSFLVSLLLFAAIVTLFNGIFYQVDITLPRTSKATFSILRMLEIGIKEKGLEQPRLYLHFIRKQRYWEEEQEKIAE